jgi:hypothetical protein
MQMKLLEITNVDFEVIDQIFYIWQKLEKKWECNGTLHQLFIDFKKACNSVRREVLYNVLIVFGIPRKLVGPTKMCLKETYSAVHIGKVTSDRFPLENGLKQGDTIILAVQLCFGICHEEGSREPGRAEIEWDTPAFDLC